MQSPVQSLLSELHAAYKTESSGEVATYIPELSTANPEWFGIAIATVDGQVYEIGDAGQTFTIQSISKPFVYGLSLQDSGEDEVLARVGLEPSGDAFNAISLDPASGRPFNPMINAGAIATTGLVHPKSSDRVERIREALSGYAGRSLDIDLKVFESEKSTGHRNRAISHLLRNFEVIDSDPAPVVDAYFSQCSVAVNCRDLAIMAGTLANRGANPVTGQIVLDSDHVESVLSVMGSCGMYDYAGEWLYRVGMPAKSGVSGGVLAVLPGQFGVGVFSPPLDARGNSVRGVAVCSDLSHRFDLHQYNVPAVSRSVVRASYDGSSARSKRVRTTEQDGVLSVTAERIRIIEVQGEIVFGSAEALVRTILDLETAFDCLVIDVARVTWWQPAAGKLIEDLTRTLVSAGKAVAISSLQAVPALADALSDHPGEALLTATSLDPALEWCENILLHREGANGTSGRTVDFADNDFVQGLDVAAISALQSVLARREFAAGDLIIRAGDEASSLFLLERGEASVLANTVGRRLATYSAGTAFGEMAFLGQTTRTADVRADTDCLCYELNKDDFTRLTAEAPWLAATMYANLGRKLAANLAQANLEIAALHAGA